MDAIDEGRIRAARGMLTSGRVAEAERLSRELVASSSALPVLMLAAEIAEAKGEFVEALERTARALELHGESAPLLLKRAEELLNLRRRSEAFACAERAAELAPPDPALLRAIAKVHLLGDAPAGARPVLQRAADLAPNDAGVLYDKALAHFYLNEMDEAERLLDRVLVLAPGNGHALFIRAQLRTQSRESNHVEELRRALARPQMPTVERFSAWFALAKELDDIGDSTAAFAALEQGNRIKRNTLKYDVHGDVSAMQNVIRTYTRETLDAIADGDPTSGAIFIVGMPRTGTTLVERILASHSDVASVGEAVDFPIEMTKAARRAHAASGSTDPDLLRSSTQLDFGELGRGYLAAVRQLAGDRPYTVDKLPFNFRYCGLIHKALPNAKILHLTRDPLDTCYAVFRTLFFNAYHFSYQLDEIAEYYIAYRRTMDHWNSVIPNSILDLRYEDLVADTERQCRRILDWCGLPWQDSVLDFHRSSAASTTASTVQVRRPVYSSSVHKWRSVAPQMQPVLRRLVEAGLVDQEGRDLTVTAGQEQPET
jgi:tetratricopeptide (TPR) repeat protein